jgi:CheY-like chemotaxis protein
MATTVLIADDADWSAVILEVLVLSLPGLRAVRAANGQEAWRLIENQPVSALITDLAMPLMDGFALIERVRTRAADAQIPIIVVSADDAPESQNRARQLGVNAYFVKPYSPAAVRETLEELLK